RPTPAPLPADGGEGPDEQAAGHRHPGAYARTVEVGAARARVHAAALDVRVLDRVDVDRQAVGVRRPVLRPGRDRVAAVEARGVVRLARALVLRAVGVDRPQAPEWEARGVEPPKDAGDVAD